jgi:hypothetical protein
MTAMTPTSNLANFFSRMAAALVRASAGPARRRHRADVPALSGRMLLFLPPMAR